jgi:hypothetical protein
VRLDARAGGRRSAAPAPGLHDGLPSLPAKKGVARGDAASGRGVVSVRDLSDLSDLSDAASGRGFVFVRDLSGVTVVVPCAREDTVAEVCARARSRGKRRARCAGLEAVAAGEGAAAAAAAAALNLAVGPRTSQSAANLGGAMGEEERGVARGWLARMWAGDRGSGGGGAGRDDGAVLIYALEEGGIVPAHEESKLGSRGGLMMMGRERGRRRTANENDAVDRAEEVWRAWEEECEGEADVEMRGDDDAADDEDTAAADAAVADDVRLQYGGRVLDSASTLGECGVTSGATLDMTVPVRGGIDGMTIMAFAILGAVALYLLYKLVLLIIKFGRWLWRFILRAPVCWCNKNMCYPLCQTCRFGVYTCKESCCALCDCCDLHYHPWKRMEVTS